MYVRPRYMIALCHLVENFFCAIKAFRRIATRYEKTDTCFAAMINLVAIFLWTR